MRALLASAAALLLSSATISLPLSAGGFEPETDSVVDASAGDGEVTVEIRYDGRIDQVPQAADPLAGCSFHGPLTAAEVRLLLAVSVGARVAPLDDELRYAVVACDTIRFAGAASAVWPTEDDPPVEVVEILAQSAIARLQISTPVPEAAPDGSTTPFLTQLPVWFWVNESSWRSYTATADLGDLGASVTASATPFVSEWSPGDGTSTLHCDGRGTEWQLASDDSNASCTHVYTNTAVWASLDLEVAVVFDLDLSCRPARLCSRVSLPTSLAMSSSRPVYVVQARGVITG